MFKCRALGRGTAVVALVVCRINLCLVVQGVRQPSEEVSAAGTARTNSFLADGVTAGRLQLTRVQVLHA